MKMDIAMLAAAAVFAVAATGCRTVPITGRTQLMLSSDASEREMGATAYGEYKAQTKPSADASQQALLARVGAAVKDAAGDTGFEWEFTVLQSDEAPTRRSSPVSSRTRWATQSRGMAASA